MSAWLEVFGRMHPMVLHLPIGFFLALCVLELAAPKAADGTARAASTWLVRLTALSAVIAVATGLLHADQAEFNGEGLELHRNLGIALGIVALAAWGFHAKIDAAKTKLARAGYRVALVAGVCLLVPTGHFGAELTHGPGFLTEPLRAEPDESNPAPPVAVLSTYDVRIRPILDAKCVPCHGDKKQKGGLSLATTASMLVGGRRGPALISAAPSTSPMFARIGLDLEHDKHMPPADHEQLEPAELADLTRWFAAGAPFEGLVEGLSSANAVASVSAGTASGTSATPVLTPVDPAALTALRAALAHVQPLGEDSGLLWVDFSASAKTLDDVAARALLAPLSAQLADLSLARSQVGDGTIEMLAGFASLQHLDLRATAVSDLGLSSLVKLPKLAELVLSQTKLSDASVDSLIAMPALGRVHLWRSGISAEAIARLREARPNLSIDDGEAPDAAALEVETTVAFTKGPAPAVAPTAALTSLSLTPINTKCPVSGAPVQPEFMIVHEGRVIGFCCPECPKQFWADPAKFLGRLQ